MNSNFDIQESQCNSTFFNRNINNIKAFKFARMMLKITKIFILYTLITNRVFNFIR